jgi:hypothetical protein
MTISSIPVVVQGTGHADRASIIRSRCKEGAPVEVRRNLTNPSGDEALEVWLQCRYFFGAAKTWKKIGYVEGGRYAAIARQLDNGQMRVRKSVVNSFFAPLDRDEPQVALELEVEWSDREAAKKGPRLQSLLGRSSSN